MRVFWWGRAVFLMIERLAYFAVQLPIRLGEWWAYFGFLICEFIAGNMTMILKPNYIYEVWFWIGQDRVLDGMDGWIRRASIADGLGQWLALTNDGDRGPLIIMMLPRACGNRSRLSRVSGTAKFHIARVITVDNDTFLMDYSVMSSTAWPI